MHGNVLSATCGNNHLECFKYVCKKFIGRVIPFLEKKDFMKIIKYNYLNIFKYVAPTNFGFFFQDATWTSLFQFGLLDMIKYAVQFANVRNRYYNDQLIIHIQPYQEHWISKYDLVLGLKNCDDDDKFEKIKWVFMEHKFNMHKMIVL